MFFLFVQNWLSKLNLSFLVVFYSAIFLHHKNPHLYKRRTKKRKTQKPKAQAMHLSAFTMVSYVEKFHLVYNLKHKNKNNYKIISSMTFSSEI